jgi:hypothetical protein
MALACFVSVWEGCGRIHMHDKPCAILMEPAKVGDSAGFFSNYQQLASIFCEIICKNCIFCIAPCPTLVLKSI